MAGRLTARKIETTKPGKYSDGGNLYLIVSPTGARKWVLRFTWRGKAREMGLGTPATVSLADARERAANARRMVGQGLDPINERKRTGGVPTFGEMADHPARIGGPLTGIGERDGGGRPKAHFPRLAAPGEA